MLSFTPLEPVDYLVVGHLTLDLTPEGPRLGGTAAYAALTARALGLRVGLVTSWGGEITSIPLDGISIVNFPAERSTTFENISTPAGRCQIIRHVAPRLEYYMVPEAWRSAPLIHLGPVAQEVEPGLVRRFPAASIGVTPQGWLRGWNDDGCVYPVEWPEAAYVLEQCQAAVFSLEDVAGNEERIEEMAAFCPVLAVTEGADGVSVYWHGDVRRFRPPVVTAVDTTGAGDIFATAFFYRLSTTRDPWEAARFANQLAAASVTRTGLVSIPTPDEVQSSLIQIITP